MNETNMKLLYNALILPLFDYADVVIDSANASLKDRLQKLQNRAGRIILKINPYSHVSNKFIHEKLGWDTLQSRRKKHTLTMVYKSLHKLVPSYLTDSFEFVNSGYILRSIGNLALQRPKTEYCRRMFTYRGSSTYNDISLQIRNGTLYSFVKNIGKIVPKYI